MSTFDDDDIEFDFFDEPDTVEETQRRRLPRLDRGRVERPREGGGPPRPPVRIAPGLTPLLRLAGLIALVILVIVFLVRGCSGNGNAQYKSYMEKVTLIAHQSDHLGRTFANKITTPGTKTSALSSAIRGFAALAQSQLADAQNLHPPGPLRTEHSHLIDILSLRADGLSRFADALDQTTSLRDASKASAKLVAQGQLLTASDANWEYFFLEASRSALQRQKVTGIAVPHSQFLPTPELVGASAMVRLFQQLHGALAGSTTSGGPHGDALVSVVAEPNGTRLSPTTPTTVKTSLELAFVVTVENSGASQELGVPVKLTLEGTNIVKSAKIDLINPGLAGEKTVRFTNFDIPKGLYGAIAKIKVEVGAVQGERNLSNNSATYQILFSL